MLSTESLLSISFSSSLARYGGDVAVGAMTVITSASQLATLPLQGICQGGQPVMSFNFGAGKKSRVKEAFRFQLTLCFGYTTLFWLLMMLVPGAVAGIFTSDAALIEYTTWAMRIYMAGIFAMGVQIACQQSFMALGQAKVSLLLACLRKIILLIPLIFILPHLVSEPVFGVFLAEPVSDILAAAVTAFTFFTRFNKILDKGAGQSLIETRRYTMEKNVLNTDLSGKVAVVTGASGTLCSIFAKALARAGAKVALLGRNMDKLKALADEIEAEGGVAKGYTCNVMNKANCLQVAEDVLADLGPCDILVNGAGGNNSRANTDKEYFEMGDLDTDTVTFFDLDESGVEMVFNLNFIGTLLPTQAFARQMVGREGCNILNISSMNAYLPLTKIPAYSGSKAAVTNFTQWLAVHFSKVGIRVNAIAPGFFASDQNAKLLYNEDGTPTARTGKILAATPMGRFGDSERDLVGALLFLLNNDAAGFITGICLPVDGGFSAYSGV